MKKTQEILGLPIISISDGLEVGRVKSIIINAEKGSIEYIVVDNGIQILSARVISTENILGVGEYAVTIENDNSINDISKIPAAIDLLQKNIQVKGTKVLTKKGRLIGEIGDIYVDENECCRITGLEYIADITQKRIRIIPRECVITLGKNLVVVAEDVEARLVDSAAQLGGEETPAEAEKKNIEIPDVIIESEEYVAASVEQELPTEVPQWETGSLEEEALIEETEVLQLENIQEAETEADEGITEIGDTAEVVDLSDTEPVKPTEETNAAGLFEQRQKQYLNGRRATKTISDDNGNIIVQEGMTISLDVIDVAKNAGKLIELVMNNKA